MKKNKSLIEEAKTIFAENGKNSYETAKEAMLKEKVEYGPLREAITYFMEEIWKNYEHPALLSLTCEAVGEKPKNLTTIGAALVLLTGAADIHDDIIDRSKRKASKPTLFGKYGTDIALLVGDALLVKGLTLLSQATQDFPEKQRNEIVTTVKDAFFEIGNAEAEETSYRGKWDADAEKLLSIMEKKAGIAAATAKLGAFIGGGSTEQVKALSEYGRTLAVLANVRNEFVDVYEPDELRHRTRNECLPLPLLYAMCNPKNKIASLLKKKRLTSSDALKVAHAMMKTEEVINLKNQMKSLVRKSSKMLEVVRNEKTKKQLLQLLNAMVEGL